MVVEDSAQESEEGVADAQPQTEEVVAAGETPQIALLTVCENGYSKRTFLKNYRRQGRAGKGLIDIKTNERNGQVIGTAQVVGGEDVMLITTAGKVIRMPVGGISVIGRNTQGVSLINLDEGERVAAVARIADSSDEEEK